MGRAQMKGRAMKNIALLILISLSTLNATVAAPAKPDWVPLFNGKDLQGWKNNGDENGWSNKVPSLERALPTSMVI